MASFDDMSPEQKVQAIYALSRGLVVEAVGLTTGRVKSPQDFLSGLSILTGLAMASTGLDAPTCREAIVKLDIEEGDGRALAMAGERGEDVTIH